MKLAPRHTAKVPIIEQVAELAMRLSRPHLADYGAIRSRHDFTQRQLMSCLVLRAYLKTTYRGVLEFVAVSPVLRRVLGLVSAVGQKGPGRVENGPFWMSESSPP